MHLILSLEGPMETALGNREDIEPQRVGRMAGKAMMPAKAVHSISGSW